MRMTKDVDLIKEKLDLTEFLRGYLTLHPAGRNFKALCPFHPEKTPSFIVSPERKIWHCFGCGEGGDLIKFAMKYENLEFPEALRFLAEKAGVAIKTLNPREQRGFDLLYEIHDEAKDFYRHELLKNAAARNYLNTRKLNDETIEEFAVGFAPQGETLTVHLIKKGYDVNDIMRAGLTNKNIRGLYRDRFQDRIIFPLANNIGRTVAFTGRILNPETAGDMPKYLNSPETPIFNKSKILYGFHKSKNFIAETRTVFLVEGQMDFLMSWQSGVKNAVAVSGTGLTPHHLERLRRMADSVVVSFDNDEAGIKALERSLDVFNNFDFHVKALNLGEYKDPAEACEKDPVFLHQAIEWAKPAFNHLLDLYFISKVDKPLGIAERKRLIRHFLMKIKAMKSAVEQDVWIKELARITNISETALFTELNNLPAATETNLREEIVSGAQETRERIDLIAERLLALALARREEFLPALKEKINLLPFVYQSILENPAEDKVGMLEMRSSFEFSDAGEETIQKEFSQLLKYLELEFLKKESEKIKQEIKRAETDGDEAALRGFAEKFNEVVLQINNLKK